MIAPPPPPSFDTLPAGYTLRAGMGVSTILPDMDFETYSEAGYIWSDALQKWVSPPGVAAGKKGLPVVGVAAYSQHPSTEVLSFSYDLKDGRGKRRWRPGMPNPSDLFAHIAAGGLIEAWNSAFEHWIWNSVCVRRYGWPPLPQAQTRDAMAKSRAHALPGALGKAAEVLRLRNQKDKDGDRLLKKFSMPRNPTKGDARLRIRPEEDIEDGEKLYAYNDQDIVAEAEASSVIPDLPQSELDFWLCDQAINYRGVQMDVAGIHDCIAIVNAAHERYNAELHALTGGAVARASELAKLQTWLHAQGVHLETLDEDAIDAAIKRGGLPPHAQRALQIRSAIGSAAVKKIFAMANQVTTAGRLHDLFSYHAAATGRATGNGPQPQNLPNSGPDVLLCGCGRHHGKRSTACPWCACPVPPGKKTIEWSAPAVLDALVVIATRSLDCVEYYFGDAVATVSGCLRGLFTAADGHDLICSDYSAIEAVGLAMVAGESWREDVFRTHGKIYETSASKITGIPFEDFAKHKAETGQHHPMRKKVGKVAELASGYQGWVGAWKAFGADEFFTDDEIKENILAWRAASPAIVELWGGQSRGSWRDKRVEYYGVEGMATCAVANPGTEYEYRGLVFVMRGDALYVRLYSGRYLTYHRPRLSPSQRGGMSLSYERWNTNPKNGAPGWIRVDTWGGRLVENIIQAVCRDILAFAIVNLERAGYRVVLHVHDEIVCEVPKGWGSVEEFERIMGTMPEWAANWPIRAAGGWRGPRYRKD